MKSLLVKKDLNLLLVTKILKKIRALCIFITKIWKDFDETKRISFLIKEMNY